MTKNKSALTPDKIEGVVKEIAAGASSNPDAEKKWRLEISLPRMGLAGYNLQKVLADIVHKLGIDISEAEGNFLEADESLLEDRGENGHVDLGDLLSIVWGSYCFSRRISFNDTWPAYLKAALERDKTKAPTEAQKEECWGLLGKVIRDEAIKLELPKEKYAPDESLPSIGLDSIDLVYLAHGFERKTGHYVSEEELVKIAVFGDLERVFASYA